MMTTQLSTYLIYLFLNFVRDKGCQQCCVGLVYRDIYFIFPDKKNSMILLLKSDYVDNEIITLIKQFT